MFNLTNFLQFSRNFNWQSALSISDRVDSPSDQTINTVAATAIGCLLITKAAPTLIRNIVRLGENAQKIASVVYILCSTNPALVNLRIIKAAVASGRHAECIASAICELYTANPLLVTYENTQRIAAAGADAREIVLAIYAIHYLSRENPALLRREHGAAVLADRANAKNVSRAISDLYRENPALLNQENTAIFLANPASARTIASAILAIYRANPALATAENSRRLVMCGEEAELIELMIRSMQIAQIAVTQDNLNLIFREERNIRHVYHRMLDLKNDNLLNQANFDRLFERDPSGGTEFSARV